MENEEVRLLRKALLYRLDKHFRTSAIPPSRSPYDTPDPGNPQPIEYATFTIKEMTTGTPLEAGLLRCRTKGVVIAKDSRDPSETTCERLPDHSDIS
jgi:hypothetical protein